MSHTPLRFDDQTIERIFGADDAENESPPRFKEYFYRNHAYEALTSDLPVRIIVGHKGVGKSALLKRAFLDDEDKKKDAVWLKPNDIVGAKTAAASQTDFILRVEAWKTGLLLEVCERLLVSRFGDGALSAIPDFENSKVRVLIRLIGMALERSNATSVNIYIDDIDRGWSANPNDIQNISALLTAARDVSGEDSRIRFRIGLRSDVYFLVRTSDESTDKIERNVVWLRWTNDEILRIAAKRVTTYFEMPYTQGQIDNLTQRQISEQILSKVIVPRYQGRGRWSDRPTYTILMSLTRSRPRDLIKLFHAAAKNAFRSQSDIITSTHLENALEPYSQERLQDIINEFKSELPEIQKLLLEMKPSKKERTTKESYYFTLSQLSEKIQNAMGHVRLSFTNGRPVSPRSIIQFLYKIDFITATKERSDGIVERKNFDQSRFLVNEIADFGYDWEIHPAYRWALQPQDIQDVIDSIKANS